MKKCTLYNKNIPVARISMEGSNCTNVESVINPEFAPISIRKFLEENNPEEINKKWLSKRAIPEKRDGLAEVVKKYGSEWNTQSYFASLTDQYWISDSADVQWKDINFFTRRYNRSVGDAFFKDWKIEKISSTDSPDITTNGLIKKRWLQLNGNESYLVKSGNVKMQQEPLNEVLASVILEKLNIIPFVEYKFHIEGFTLCSICKNFIDENTEFVPAAHFVLPMIEKKDGSDIYEKTIQVAERIGIEDYRDFMNRMLLVDYIIQNTDRHLGNFGFIRDVQSGKFIGPAPLFDNGTAFWNITSNGEAYHDKLNVPNLENILNTEKEKHIESLKRLKKDIGYEKLIDEYPYITLRRKEYIKENIQNMFGKGVKISRLNQQRKKDEREI